MKCQECGEKLDPSKVAYWRGKKVHSTCFDILQKKSKHPSRKENFLDRLFLKQDNIPKE